jgi:hypothetical protein
MDKIAYDDIRQDMSAAAAWENPPKNQQPTTAKREERFVVVGQTSTDGCSAGGR